MSPASLDLRTLATVAIFVATYAGVALGRVPGSFGTLSLEEAFKAIDLDAIALPNCGSRGFSNSPLDLPSGARMDRLCF